MADTCARRFIRYASANVEHLSGICAEPSLQFTSADRMQKSQCIRNGSQTVGGETSVPRSMPGNISNISNASGEYDNTWACVWLATYTYFVSISLDSSVYYHVTWTAGAYTTRPCRTEKFAECAATAGRFIATNARWSFRDGKFTQESSGRTHDCGRMWHFARC